MRSFIKNKGNEYILDSYIITYGLGGLAAHDQSNTNNPI